jgi:IclR family acetate operon transcriptional repressor
MCSMGTQQTPIRSVETAFRLLEELLERKGATLGELAQEFDKPKSTTHDYMKTLMDLGIVAHENNRYYLTTELLNIGTRVRNQRALYQVAKPEVERLARETGQMSGLIKKEQGLAVTLYYHNTVTDIQLEPYPGLRTKLHTTSGGKAMLAELPESRVSKIVSEHGLDKKTRHTITDYEGLLSELETVREQGYAVSAEERIIGMQSLGAAITNREGFPVGALVVAGPVNQMQSETQDGQALKDLLLNIANVVEVNLNYR